MLAVAATASFSVLIEGLNMLSRRAKRRQEEVRRRLDEVS